ncbi:MAG: TIGR02221 family CRISPR-associated protein [Candidatus Contendobacter sp.]|jgi:CRISPR-associated Csx2 family protein|nr:TIGR02221 family CRISPR-associated protein [Gammaproteobacteria bacterium]MCC8994951.1 TIGR02221 family CRISPR-associated protein [Candidatus Contendobacter sp.]
MTHTLISFLGKAAQSYRKATYDFGDGQRQETAFFGLGLTRHIKPDRLVVLGTTGSMWDVLLISLNLEPHLDEALLELSESAQQDCTSETELNALAPAVGQRLGLPVTLRLIPYGQNIEEQVEILQRIALDIAEGDAVTLDVTHGLRHLPILAQMSALYLRQVKDVEIRGLYYGALDMTRDGLTPVMNLGGLLDIADWTGAVQSFDKDGDYSVFASLMQKQSPVAADLLQKSAFYERTTRPGQARSQLRNLFDELEHQPLTGIGLLFAPTLQTRLAWHLEDRLYLRQQALARLYLEHEDFLRAALLGFEAFITRLMQQRGMNNPDNWTQRELAKKQYLNKGIYPRNKEYENYCLLRDLRNHLAHGNASPQVEIQKALASAETLRHFLDDLFRQLLPASIDR